MQQSYKLVNCWVLDGESDIHVCNNSERFTMEKLIEDEDIIIFEKTTHKIEAFGTVEIIAKTSKKSIAIKLLNVAFVSEYFTNLMCLDRFEEKGIFHDSKNDRLHRKGETYCLIQRVDRHKVIEYNPPQTSEAEESYGAFVSSSDPSSILQATGAEWHQLLGHSSSKIISKLENSAKNIQMTDSDSIPTINSCEICALIKAHKLISKRPDHEKSANAPFQRTGFDLIQEITSYNEGN